MYKRYLICFLGCNVLLQSGYLVPKIILLYAFALTKQWFNMGYSTNNGKNLKAVYYSSQMKILRGSIENKKNQADQPWRCPRLSSNVARDSFCIHKKPVENRRRLARSFRAQRPLRFSPSGSGVSLDTKAASGGPLTINHSPQYLYAAPAFGRRKINSVPPPRYSPHQYVPHGTV